MRHTTELTVRFYELDAYGHVNHAVYLNYFETARITLLAEIGFGLDRLKAEGFHLVVVEATARFHEPASMGERLTIASEVTDVRRASSSWHQEMTRDGARIATLDLRAAVTALDGRPTRAPEELAVALRRFTPD